MPPFCNLLSRYKVVSSRASHWAIGAVDGGDGDYIAADIPLCWRFRCIRENCGHLDGCWVERNWVWHQDPSFPRSVLRRRSEDAAQDGSTAPWLHKFWVWIQWDLDGTTLEPKNQTACRWFSLISIFLYSPKQSEAMISSPKLWSLQN